LYTCDGWPFDFSILILRTLYVSPMHGYRLLGEVNELLTGRRAMKQGASTPYSLARASVLPVKDIRLRLA
jgi:hypothetical protein